MSNISLEAQISRVLDSVVDPESGLSVVDLGMVRQVTVDRHGWVTVEMVLLNPPCPLAACLVEQVERAFLDVVGVEGVRITLSQEAGMALGPMHIAGPR